MKKTIFEHFGFWLRGVVCGALLLSAAVACSDDNDDPGAAAPEITLESVSTGQTEFSFRLRTNVDGAYGYQVVKRTQNDGIEKPDAASLFDEHTGTVNKDYGGRDRFGDGLFLCALCGREGGDAV